MIEKKSYHNSELKSDVGIHWSDLLNAKVVEGIS